MPLMDLIDANSETAQFELFLYRGGARGFPDWMLAPMMIDLTWLNSAAMPERLERWHYCDLIARRPPLGLLLMMMISHLMMAV